MPILQYGDNCVGQDWRLGWRFSTSADGGRLERLRRHAEVTPLGNDHGQARCVGMEGAAAKMRNLRRIWGWDIRFSSMLFI